MKHYRDGGRSKARQRKNKRKDGRTIEEKRQFRYAIEALNFVFRRAVEPQQI